MELGSNAPSPPARSTPKLGQEHIVNVMNEGVAGALCRACAATAELTLRAAISRNEGSARVGALHHAWL